MVTISEFLAGLTDLQLVKLQHARGDYDDRALVDAICAELQRRHGAPPPTNAVDPQAQATPDCPRAPTLPPDLS
jgi:hypothetical protein